ncbi:MAG: hypothetical protein LBG67_02855 [Campylobacteraceae bacterium]|jgi:hypothetical protein|nr:hypothetical protein [Campylobacteraceae bacterium]
MTNAELTQKLRGIKITRKEFAGMVGLKYPTVLQWAGKGKTIPLWVNSWLELYEKAKKYDELTKKFMEQLQKTQ